MAEIEDKRLTVEQYEQLHEMRREYNRFIFQAPTIVVAVVGGSFFNNVVRAGSAKVHSEPLWRLFGRAG